MKNLIKKSHAIYPEALPSGSIYTSLSGMSKSRSLQRKRLKAFDIPNPTATPRASSKSPFGGFRGLFFLLLFCFATTLANAQAAGTPYPTPFGNTTAATERRDFWVSFGKNSVSTAATDCYLALQLNNGNNSPVTVTLTFTVTGQSASYTVPANTSQQVDLSYVTPAGGTTGDSLGDMRQYIYHSGTNSSVSDTTLHITSPAVISVIAFNTQSATTDATILLPSTIWGQDYYNFSYQALNNLNLNRNVHMIIANQNNTHVTITDYTGATQATAMLNVGQVYYGVGTGNQDLTGMHITTDKPVSYFMHNTVAYINTNVSYGDILFQQLMPTGRYGQFFLVPNETQFSQTQYALTGTNLVRVLAAQNGTVVNFTNANAYTDTGYTQGNGYVSAGTSGSSVSSITLGKGQWTTVQIAGGQSSYCTIAANQPIGVVDFMQGGTYGANYRLGDPAICRISPVTSMVSTAVIAPFIPPASFSRGGSSNLGISNTAATPRHYALIVAPTASKDAVTISRNGVSLGTLTAAAAAVPNITDPAYTGTPNITAPATWTDVPTPLNGVLYSYIRYDFNYLTDAAASFRITAAANSGVLISQVGIGLYESYSMTSGAGY